MPGGEVGTIAREHDHQHLRVIGRFLEGAVDLLKQDA